MSLPEIATAGLEEAINRYLALDPDVVARLEPMHGRVIAFELVGLGTTLYLVPGPGRLQVFGRYEGEPDCTLCGTPFALARMGDRREGPDRLFSGEVRIAGDTELAHRFGEIIGAIDIDWEEQLSRVTGDLVAHEIGNAVRGGARWGRNTLRTFGLNLQEYLQEELQLLPNRAEVQQFLDEVDTLRDDVERLEARIERQRQGAGSAP